MPQGYGQTGQGMLPKSMVLHSPALCGCGGKLPNGNRSCIGGSYMAYTLARAIDHVLPSHARKSLVQMHTYVLSTVPCRRLALACYGSHFLISPAAGSSKGLKAPSG